MKKKSTVYIKRGTEYHLCKSQNQKSASFGLAACGAFGTPILKSKSPNQICTDCVAVNSQSK